MKKPALIDVTVLVDVDKSADFAAVASALKQQGFVLNEILADIGVLTGAAPAGALSKLSAVPGVASVEQQRGDYRPQG